MLPRLPSSLLCALTLLFAAPAALHAQTTINVPADQPSIQKAITAAQNGDTIVVASNTYRENINFLGKSITVTGLPFGADPDKVVPPIIDGGARGPAVRFVTGETDGAVLSYFTIRNGGNYASYPSPGVFVPAAGGIYISDSYPKILNNTITENICFGIQTDYASPLIQGNTISATQDPGGNCFFGGGSGILIVGDRTTNVGGIVPAMVIGNTIENNVESGNDPSDTQGEGGGAGIAAGGSTLIEDNIIRDNATTQTGGGIDISYATGLTILQNVIVGNSASSGGGAIGLPLNSDGPTIDLIVASNTIVDNTGPVAQIYPILQTIDPPIVGPTVIVVDNIIAGSTASPAVDCSADNAPSEALQPIFDHNILYNAGGKFFGPSCIDVSAKYGNLGLDPKFQSQTAGRYQLTPASPAIDAGNNSELQDIFELSGIELTQDIANSPRLQDGLQNGTGPRYPVIDMGAYEYSGVVETSPSTAVLTFASYTNVPNSVEALTATVQSPLGTPTGTVTFFLDGNQLKSPVALDSNGTANLSGFTLSPGVHSLYVYYPGQGVFTPATSIVNIIQIDLITTTVTVQSSSVIKPPQSFLGEPVTFTVTSKAADGTIPTPITLTDDNMVLQTFNFAADSTGIGTFTTSSLALGPHTIKAAYAGSPLYAAASETITQLVTGYPTTTVVSCGAAANTTVQAGTVVPLSATVTSTQGTPTGSVNFTLQSTQIGQATLADGSGGITYTTQIPGFNTIIANYVPASGSAFAASSGTCSFEVQALSLSITSNNNPAFAYTPITFTANLAGQTIPAGVFTLTIGTNAPVTMNSNAGGASATYTTSALGAGTYPVTVTFTPADKSAPVTAILFGGEIVNPPNGDFTLTGPPGISIPTEASGTAALLLTSINDFSGTIALTCSLPLPTTYTCTLAPPSVTLADGGTAGAIVTLAPAARKTAAIRRSEVSRIVMASLLPLTLLSLAGFARRRRGMFRGLLPLVVLTVLAASATGCGKDVFFAATAPGAYPVTITASGTTRGATTPTTHTLTITLNLLP